MDTLEKKPVFLHLNTSGLVSESPFVFNEPRWKETGLKIYSSREQFLEETGIFITFMSSLVFRTELVRKVENKEQYIGTYFIQSYIALATMRSRGYILLIPIIILQPPVMKRLDMICMKYGFIIITN